MNVALIDPFILAQDFPDTLVGQIRASTCLVQMLITDSGHCTSLRFNRTGELLASGRADGVVVILDVDTNGVAQKLRGHVRQIQSVSDGHYLLSAAQDCKCILWDLAVGEQIRTVRFEAPVYIAELHATNPFVFVGALLDHDPVYVDMSDEDHPVKQTLPTTQEEEQKAKQLTLVTIFSASARHIITGTNRGFIHIIDSNTREIVHSTRICSSLILLLRLSSSGRHLLCNASDKIVRTIALPNLDAPLDNVELEVEHRFQDVVQKLSWNWAVFSSTSDYVAATTYMNRDIYLWERGHGSLVKILECPAEELGNIEWHPSRPLVTACGLESGCIYLWSIIAPQRWSALAPDFAEVEENVEYVEKEDEFDIRPIEEIHKRRLDLEDEEVDVLTFDAGKLDDHHTRFHLPVLLDIADSDESDEDLLEIGPDYIRRKTPGGATESAKSKTGISNGAKAARGRGRS